ncbi:FAD-dependent oxidoreductase [Candidatus Bathyarchaeota archaeon]|nr:FAD-dependent oxidoreductase [Candidatus Bathyarchaeota archaeon]
MEHILNLFEESDGDEYCFHERIPRASDARRIGSIYAGYDACVIGAGLAGLSTALKLARSGKRVLVLEKNRQVGGYAVNFIRGPYRLEGSLQMMDGARKGESFGRILEELGIENRLECVEIEKFLTKIDRQNECKCHMSLNEAEFLEEITSLYPAEEGNIKKFFKMITGMASFLKDWNDSTTLGKVKLALKNFGKIPRLVKYFNKSARDVLDAYFMDEGLKEDIFKFACFFGAKMHELSAIVFFAATFVKFITGAQYILGGSGELTRLLAIEIALHGGVILLNHQVVHAKLNGDVVHSIIALDKEAGVHVRIKARAFCWCCDPRILLDQVLDQGDVKKFCSLSNHLERQPVADSIFSVYLGLDVDMKDLGYTEYAYCIKLKDGTEFLMYIYSNVDPTCCPAGHSNIMLLRFMPFDAFHHSVVLDEHKRGHAYRQLKKAAVDRVIHDFEEGIGKKGILKHLRMKAAATPITYWRYTGSHDGSFVGFKATFNQSIRHPTPQKTSMVNLVLAGQWVGIGGGYALSMRSGILAAGKMMDQLSKMNKEKDSSKAPIHLNSLDVNYEKLYIQ